MIPTRWRIWLVGKLGGETEHLEECARDEEDDYAPGAPQGYRYNYVVCDELAWLDNDSAAFTTLLNKISSPDDSVKISWMEDELFPRSIPAAEAPWHTGEWVELYDFCDITFAPSEIVRHAELSLFKHGEIVRVVPTGNVYRYDAIRHGVWRERVC